MKATLEKLIGIFFDKTVVSTKKVKKVTLEYHFDKGKIERKLFAPMTVATVHAPVRMPEVATVHTEYLFGVQGLNVVERENA